MAEEDTLLREVNEALRHDQMAALWRQYRAVVLAAVIGLIVATGGASVWHNYKEKRGSAAMAALDRAQTLYGQGKFAQAAAGFAAMADHAPDADIRDMGHLWQARALEKNGDHAQAVTVLADLADHPAGSDGIWADLACLRLAGLDESKANCLANGASPLKAERDLARAAQLWRAGDGKQAAELLTKRVQDPDGTETMRTRAQHYLTVVGQADAAK